MANVLAALGRTANMLNLQAFLLQSRPILVKLQANRNLYAHANLGIDSFVQQKQRVLNQFISITPKFKQKMKESVSEDSKLMVFTDDMKNMIHLAADEEDVELVIKMLKKFNQQDEQLRFGNFVFGPVVMRMFHTLNKPDMALECFTSPDLRGMFDQVITYQLLLDLLYENQKYKEMIDCFKVIQDSQIEGIKYAKNVIVLIFAACYKMNTKESLDYALALWKDLFAIGHYPMRRGLTFCAALALKHGKPGVTLEIISNARNLNYTTIRNLKVEALIALGRLEEALGCLKSILIEDVPHERVKHTYNEETVNIVKEAIEKSGKQELVVEFNRIESYLQKQDQISKSSLDEQLCQTIEKFADFPNKMNKSFARPPRFSGERREVDGERIVKQRQPMPRKFRPGLSDLQ